MKAFFFYLNQPLDWPHTWGVVTESSLPCRSPLKFHCPAVMMMPVSGPPSVLQCLLISCLKVQNRRRCALIYMNIILIESFMLVLFQICYILVQIPLRLSCALCTKGLSLECNHYIFHLDNRHLMWKTLLIKPSFLYCIFRHVSNALRHGPKRHREKLSGDLPHVERSCQTFQEKESVR